MKRWERRVLGVLALGGGVVGIYQVANFLGESWRALPGPAWAILPVLLGLFLWGIWSGLLMLEGDRRAESHGAWFWGLQIPYFSSPFLTYKAEVGFSLKAYVQLAPFNARAGFHMGTTMQVGVLEDGTPWMAGVNVFALWVLWLLLRRMRGLRQEAPVVAPVRPEEGLSDVTVP